MNINQISKFYDKTSSDLKTLKLLSYNVQVGITTAHHHHYVTHSWKYVLPHAARETNLRGIAGLIRDYDIVGLQELDSGSLRSGFINQTEYLALHAGFPYWADRTNRNIGNMARHSLGLLSKVRSTQTYRQALPGWLPGRGALISLFGYENPLVLVLVHLALGRRGRMQQMEYIVDLLQEYQHVIVMGDMNCSPESAEFQVLRDSGGLQTPLCELPTYPSWKPRKRLDHILVSPSIRIKDATVLDSTFSDHLPLSMEIYLPQDLQLCGRRR